MENLPYNDARPLWLAEVQKANVQDLWLFLKGKLSLLRALGFSEKNATQLKLEN